MDLQVSSNRPRLVTAEGLRARAAATAEEPGDGFRASAGEKPPVPLWKRAINAGAWGSGGALVGMWAYPGAQWLTVQAALGLAALGAAGPAFALRTLADTIVPLATVTGLAVGAGTVGWRTTPA